MIQLDNEQYRLYAAVDPDSNGIHYTKLEATKNIITDQFSQSSAKKYNIDDTVFLFMVRFRFTKAVGTTASIVDTNDIEIESVINIFFMRLN